MKDSDSSRGKIELTIDNLSFAGEGDQDWLDQQINKLLDTASRIRSDNPVGGDPPKLEPKQNGTAPTESLASYLKAKSADAVQVQRFLATAGWLQRRGEEPLTTGAVAKALRDNQQKRLANPSDCLNKNVGRGFCEKTDEGFFITPEGWKHLGDGEEQ